MNSKEKEFLEAHLFDAVEQADKRKAPKFVGFLDSAGVAVATKVANVTKAKFLLFGGFKSAERVYFGAFPDWCEPSEEMFPIVKLKIVNKSSRELKHSDYLGALMSLGLERDTVGDIIVGDKESYVFVDESVAEYVISQVTKIGSSGVEVFKDDSKELEVAETFSDFSDTIASKRLDCVVAALGNCSRGKAVEMIESGIVSVGGLEVTKVTKEITEGDVISIRRKGKFIVDGISDVTKKGRLVLKYRKYT